MGGACSTNRTEQKLIQNLAGKPEKGPLERPKCRWKDLGTADIRG
jgi:hypothetical protein